MLKLLHKMKIMPHVYLIWLMGGFLRGFTWYGGILQSQYLQVWNKRTCEILSETGMKDIKNSRENYDCSGYLSGPIFMLFDTGDGAVNAGVLEFLAFPPKKENLERLFAETDLKSAHKMGMFEFYNDILQPAEKKDGWYAAIAKYSKENYEKHSLQNL